MTQDVNALLIFCEGPQDISFVRHVMECFLGFERAELKWVQFFLSPGFKGYIFIH